MGHCSHPKLFLSRHADTFIGIFFDKAGETTPAVFTQFLSKLVAAPEVSTHLVPSTFSPHARGMRY
jgi:hypothetical protein